MPLVAFVQGTQAQVDSNTLADGTIAWATDTRRMYRVAADGKKVLVGPYDLVEAENKAGSTVAAGTVVAAHSSGSGFTRCDNSAPGAEAFGLAVAAVASAVSGFVQTAGLMTLADWTAVTGTGSLAARAVYFADPDNPGMLTDTPPTTPGQLLQPVGVAVAPQSLNIAIRPPTKL